MKPLFALLPDFKNVFGPTEPSAPPGVAAYTPSSGEPVAGLTILFSNLLKVIIFAAGLYSLINLITAGILYIGSNGSPETIKLASARIWMSLLGLIIVAGSIALAAIIGLIFFNDATAILLPTILAP